jgi:3-oxoacyl-[acyl-carrier-protein] synthase II
MAVVVTGLGLCSPLGMDVPTNWRMLNVPSPFALSRFLAGEGKYEGLARAKELVEIACAEALKDAGLWDGHALQDIDPERIGCTVSASKPLFEEDVPHPPDVINDFIVQRFGLEGESRNVIAACATGAYSIALGASWIEQGLCDIVLAGSVEPYPHPLIAAGFQQMGVMSADGITRPFDQRRSGFTFGEGAGVVVLESEEHFKKRIEYRKSIIDNRSSILDSGPYARLSGWALGCDSHSAVAFNSNGMRIAGVIDRALARGGIPAKAVRHVNAHGTATRLNDWIETQALLQAFGPHAGGLMISATKASTGHLLGASGSVEFIFTTLALRHQFIPPTATLEEADPKCFLDYTPQKGHDASFEHALSLSFGFGGPIGALVISSL